MKVLGISAHYHDSAAALLVDGVPFAAAQEERFSRRKHDPSFPEQAVRFCLGRASLDPADLDAVVFYDKPLRKFERILMTALETAPRGFAVFAQAMPGWLKEKLWVPGLLERRLPGAARYLFATHHGSHAASAYYPSPFERAAVLTVDGVGEWATCSFGVGDGGDLRLLREIRFPHSLGLLYSAFTAYLGFRVNDGEYKVMGLAPYGEPRFLEKILGEVVMQRGDGSFRLNMDYFAFRGRLTMTTPEFHRLFGGPPREPGSPLEDRHLDIAASVQVATENILLQLVRYVFEQTGEQNLCLGGGVALNCVANGRILRESPFQRLWIQPAAGDAGAALGAAYVGHRALGGTLPPRGGSGDQMSGALLGPEYGEEEMAAELADAGVAFTRMSLDEMVRKAAVCLAAGNVVGWFQGRMEFGPRALGGRSILADARRPEMWERINRQVKFREGFRPFAPAVLEERAQEFFDLAVKSPYMLMTAPLKPVQRLPIVGAAQGLDRRHEVRSTVPAVTHVDWSSRVQTVGQDGPPLFRKLLEAFARETGCPLLLNTSFNVRGSPIVCRPADAVECFLETGLDTLVLGPFWAEKRRNDDLVPEPR
ncbi:MAG: carbamoyltransferase [Deferrisomatales bacterium]|nr:carbamoyltransferase [Deferrisomatales bacterium]